MNVPNEDDEIKTVDGTSSLKSYFVVARRGNIILSAKPEGIVPGAAYGADDKTYIYMRIRSAFAPQGLFPDDDDTVIDFGSKQLNLETAWPDIEFENVPDEGAEGPNLRASTEFGIFLRGTFTETPYELLPKLKGPVLDNMASSLIDIIGEHAVVTKAQLAAALHSKFDPVIDNFESQLNLKKSLSDTIDADAETFVFIKKKLNNLMASVKEPEPKG